MGWHVAELATPTVLSRKPYQPIGAHNWATLLMVGALAPVLRVARLPLPFAWADFCRDYWAVLVSESIIGGLILYVAGAPVDHDSTIRDGSENRIARISAGGTNYSAFLETLTHRCNAERQLR